MAKRKKDLTQVQETFCQMYAENNNATLCYKTTHPNVTYGSARVLGAELLANVNIKERIDELKEEFKAKYIQSKELMIRDLHTSAEQFKAAGDHSAYNKAKELIIKMTGMFEAEKVEHSGEIKFFDLKIPGLENESRKDTD